MNRRSLLKLFAATPFIAPFAKADNDNVDQARRAVFKLSNYRANKECGDGLCMRQGNTLKFKLK